MDNTSSPLLESKILPNDYLEVPILLFVNQKSRSQNVNRLINEISALDFIHLVKLPDQAFTWFKVYSDIIDDGRLRVISAGGDGTFNWVLSLLVDYYGSEDTGKYRPPLSVLPLGTGNDMSRMLGWGKSFSLKDFIGDHGILSKMMISEKIHNVDIWRAKYTRTDVKSPVTVKDFVNYMSVGVDAKMCTDYETCRQANPYLFCTHFTSYFMYVPVSFASLFFQPSLEKIIAGFLVDRDDKKVRLPSDSSCKSLVFQNITRIYGGSDLWGNDPCRSIDDGLIEVMEQGGAVDIGLNKLGKSPVRVAQAKKVKFETLQPTYIQIDGEGYFLTGPCAFTLKVVGSYPILFCDD